MGTSKISNILTLTATLILSVMGVVSTANAMPVDRNVGKLEAQGACLECNAVYRDNGLEKTRAELLHLTGLVSADGRDPRHVQSRAGSKNPYAPIGLVVSVNKVPDGKLKNGLDSRTGGTAFLISPCYIMTNHHVAFNNRLIPDPSVDYTMSFQAGELGTANSETVLARPVKDMTGTFGKAYDIDGDWAVLRLDKCIGEKLGWFNLPSSSIETFENVPVISAGFPEDKHLSKLMVQNDCTVIVDSDRDGNRVVHTTCASQPGNSGSPVFVRQPGRAPTAIAMISMTEDYSTVVKKSMSAANRNLNTAFDIANVLFGNLPQVAQDAARLPNPLASDGTQVSSTR